MNSSEAGAASGSGDRLESRVSRASRDKDTDEDDDEKSTEKETKKKSSEDAKSDDEEESSKPPKVKISVVVYST